MISFISSFEIITVVLESRLVILILESDADASAVNSNDNKTLLANCVCTFFMLYQLLLMDQEH